MLAIVGACGAGTAETVPAVRRPAAVAAARAHPVYRDLPPHRALEPLPELTRPGVVVNVSPGEFSTWDDMLARPADTYALAPGDYTSMGVLILDERWQGTAQRRKVIRYVEANVPPWRRRGEALIAGFQAGGSAGNPGRHVILHGLTMRGGTWENSIRNGSTGIVVDQVLMEDWHNPYGIRILLYAHHNVIQRSVFANQPVGRGTDAPAIQIRIPKRGQLPLGGSSTMHGNRIVNNQVLDYVDSFAITHKVTPVPTHTGIANGTVIAGNRFVTTARRRLASGYGSTENALDIKGGSSDPRDPVLIIDNELAGFRYTDTAVAGSGSDGAAIVVHNWARNVVIARNRIRDVPIGIRVDVWPSGQPQVPRGIVIKDCQFRDIGIYAPKDRGVALQARLPIWIRGNVFVNARVILDRNMLNGQHTMADNVSVSVPLGTAASPWAAGVRNVVMTEAAAAAAGLLGGAR